MADSSFQSDVGPTIPLTAHWWAWVDPRRRYRRRLGQFDPVVVRVLILKRLFVTDDFRIERSAREDPAQKRFEMFQ